MWPWVIIAKRDLGYYRDRIAELEAQVKDEHRAQRHLLNMFLRRQGTFPVPEPKSAKPVEPKPPQLSGVALGMAQAIRDQGMSLQLTEADIDAALRDRTGLSLAELKQHELTH